MTVIILLDVDGVLVHDRGYRAGVVSAIEHFSRGLGLTGLAPTTREIDNFQAAGFTNEWDMIPFVVGILKLLAASGAPVQRPDYQEWAERSLAHDGCPSERALAALLAELSRRPLARERETLLRAGLVDLLAETYNVYGCPTTQVFQEFVLGSSLYAEHYGLAARFDTPSLLEEKDESALTPDGHACLARLITERGARVCIYTARPSGPPRQAGAAQGSSHNHPLPQTGHSPLAPEAELAVGAVGLGQYPLIAMGRMEWLADQHGEPVESLTKPSPVQPLAAVGAAWSGDEVRALEAAYELFNHGALRPPLADLAGEKIDIFVLEDATPGLLAAEGAQRWLRASGLSARLRGIGVTSSPSKVDALSPHCETIVPDVNAGLDWLAKHIED